MNKTSLAAAFLVGFCLIGLKYYFSADRRPQRNGRSAERMRAPLQSGKGRRKACADDLNNFCQDIKQGPEQSQCLKEHASDLSPDCRKVINIMGTPLQSGKGSLKACADDLNNFCQDIKQGPERSQCLKEHESDLSPDCRKAVNNMSTPPQGGKGRMKACAEDVDKFCKDSAQGPERSLCLKEHESDLSPDCRKAVKRRGTPQQGGKGLMKACAEDVDKFCKDVAQGPKRPLCLKKHASDLSPDCRKAVNNMSTPQQKR